MKPKNPEMERRLSVKADAAALGDLKRALVAAGYSRDAVRLALHTDRSLTANPGEVVVFEHRLAGRSPLETLIRLFLIGSTVSAADADAALPSIGLTGLESLGVLESNAGGVRSTMRIVPHGDVFVACDRLYYGDAEHSGADVVTGVTSPAILLADLTIRRRSRRGLDLGTGGGIQALLLANHCDRVVAIDINPRALEFAELNLRLNGVGNVDLRRGSWFDPVEGERFDVLCANPPYVMSPDSTFLYRDSGLPADSLCRRLVGDMPRYLDEGGIGHILVSWALREGQEWSEPLRGWVVDSGCDAWLLHYLTDDPLTQAAKWNEPLLSDGLPTYGAAIERWVDYYRREGIERIAFGAVVLRRRSGGVPNWVRADSFRAGSGSSAGLVLRVFEAEDFLRGLRDASALLGERFALVPEHRLEQRMRSVGGQWQLDESTLTLTQGVAFHGTLDINTAQILQHLDGRHTLREAVAKTRRDLGLPSADLAPLTETALAMARRLYQLGFLVRTA